MCTVQMLLSIIALSLALVLVLVVVGLGVAFTLITTQQREEIQALRIQVNDSVQMNELHHLQHNISTIADDITALYSNVSSLEGKFGSILASMEAFEQSNVTCPQCWVMLVSLNKRQNTTEETIHQISSSIIQLWNETSELTVNIEEGDEQLNNSITQVEIGLRSEITSTEFELRSWFNVTTANATSEIRGEVQAAIAQLRSEVNRTEQELSSINTTVANLAGLPTNVSQLSSKIEDTERRINHSIDSLRKSISSAAHQHAISATVLVALFSTMPCCFS